MKQVVLEPDREAAGIPVGRSARAKGRRLGHWQRFLLEGISVAVAAIAAQIVLPASTPLIEKWVFQATGISLSTPFFLVTAQRSEIEEGGKPEIGRLFCGTSIYSARYCLMHSTVPNFAERPGFWPLNGDYTTKAVLIGDQSNQYQISWMSQSSGAGGYAFVDRRIRRGVQDYAGAGIACVTPDGGTVHRTAPLRVVYGTLKTFPIAPNDTDGDGFLGALREQLLTGSPLSITVDRAGPCPNGLANPQTNAQH